MNLNWSLPARMPSSTSFMGTPWEKGPMSSGMTTLAAMAMVPPTMVQKAAGWLNPFQKTPRNSATTSGGVTAAVKAPWAE